MLKQKPGNQENRADADAVPGRRLLQAPKSRRISLEEERPSPETAPTEATPAIATIAAESLPAVVEEARPEEEPLAPVETAEPRPDEEFPSNRPRPRHLNHTEAGVLHQRNPQPRKMPRKRPNHGGNPGCRTFSRFPDPVAGYAVIRKTTAAINRIFCS